MAAHHLISILSKILLVAIKSPGDLQSPWRRIFEDVRRSVGNTRDGSGVLGSINWLRNQMKRRGANPNVVRNIIYRNRGRPKDKRVLFDILNQLWMDQGNSPLQVSELEVFLSLRGDAEQEILRALGREKRSAYCTFVSGVWAGSYPKLLITGQPGSGKTLLTDYIQQALDREPKLLARIVRFEFAGPDLADSLAQLGTALEVPQGLMESKLVKIDSSSAFAVQADAQADIARVILDTIKQFDGSLVLLLHVSQSIGGLGSISRAPLRLNTPEVPRVSATEWLWRTLLEPISRMVGTSILVTMADVPARTLQRLGRFQGPIRLNPPLSAEARRFVRAYLPYLPADRQELIVQRAGRSFEGLRTLVTETRELETEEGRAQSAIARQVVQSARVDIREHPTSEPPLAPRHP